MTTSNQTTIVADHTPALRAKRLGLLTQDEAIVLMRSDCHVCRSEGLSPRARVLLSAEGREVVATLYQVDNDWLDVNEAGLTEATWKKLAVADGAPITVRHAPTVESLADVRKRIYGGRLDSRAFRTIVGDIVGGHYVDIHLAAFITACSAFPLDLGEMTHLTRAMVEVGEHLSWPSPVVVDKHCVGGLPGNRTTPIVVAILASLGLVMPKTSSRAITSPAGTADAMETLAPVDLDLAQMRSVVEKEGACIVWGGAVRLSPADDVLIRIERALDIDTEGQLIASVLSKKIAAGSTHVVLDLPVGPTAKVRTAEAAKALSRPFDGGRGCLRSSHTLRAHRWNAASRSRNRTGAGGQGCSRRTAVNGGSSSRLARTRPPDCWGGIGANGESAERRRKSDGGCGAGRWARVGQVPTHL